MLFGRAAAWLGRGVRSPAKKALLAADVPPNAYGRAFGLERLMDTLGAIGGPLTALWLLEATGHLFRKVFLWTLLPGMIAVAAFWLLVRERPMEARAQRIVDLGAAPGGWAQVAVERVKSREGRGRVIGIDLLEIEAIAGAEFRVMDFHDPAAPGRLREWLAQRSRSAP